MSEMPCGKPLRVWARDDRVSYFLLIWALVASISCIYMHNRYDSGHESNDTARDMDVYGVRGSTDSGSNLRVNHMIDLVEKQALKAEHGLGYEYEAGRKCPYKFHGGSPSEGTPVRETNTGAHRAAGTGLMTGVRVAQVRGSCWCGLDSYCMCTPSLAIDAILELLPQAVGIEIEDQNVGDDGSGSGRSKETTNMNTIQLILVRRRDPPRDQYAITGGFVDVGESIEHAVQREVKEETNLYVPIPSLNSDTSMKSSCY